MRTSAMTVSAGRRVLVTGGAGFIGTRVVAGLRHAGHDVLVADSRPPADPEVEHVRGDLLDPAIREKAFAGGVDAVVHLAAFTSVLKSVEVGR